MFHEFCRELVVGGPTTTTDGVCVILTTCSEVISIVGRCMFKFVFLFGMLTECNRLRRLDELRKLYRYLENRYNKVGQLPSHESVDANS